MKPLSILVLLILFGCSSSSPMLIHGKPEQPDGKKLWAAISINEPVFITGWTNNLQIFFTLVNDTGRTINPEIESSQIIVNGNPWPDSGFILGNGPMSNNFTALPPKDYIMFEKGLGEKFKEPGIYRIFWKGKSFETPEIVFRVLPQKQK